MVEADRRDGSIWVKEGPIVELEDGEGGAANDDEVELKMAVEGGWKPWERRFVAVFVGGVEFRVVVEVP